MAEVVAGSGFIPPAPNPHSHEIDHASQTAESTLQLLTVSPQTLKLSIENQLKVSINLLALLLSGDP